MADCVSLIWDFVTRLWNCTANRVQNIRDFPDNLNSLRELKRELENISKDVEGRADFAELQQYSARDEEIQQKCLGSYCPRHCCTSCKLRKQVSKEIDVVTKLIEKGSSVVVADKVPRPMIYEMPMENTVGMESSFDEVWKCVEDNRVGIIGLYEVKLDKIQETILNKIGIQKAMWIGRSEEERAAQILERLRNKRCKARMEGVHQSVDQILEKCSVPG
ncbi:hypothetical protein LWI28_016270 [Acer negundo]|uniref:Uncharacterized protein n=1 Tax=Acer negundo TaxID=4023 RepID=A0AAD5IEJ8_ACENE|nr:hypothetical protein LWI28_016270 [Acer negundo]